MSAASSYAVEGESGERYIPSSQRADGTWRKARKVKEGYVPQDEVPLYQSKGKQWAAGRSSYPVGLDPALIRAKEAEAAEKQKKQRETRQPVEPSHSVLNPVVSKVANKSPQSKDKPPSTSSMVVQDGDAHKWKEVKTQSNKKKEKSKENNKDKTEKRNNKNDGSSTAVAAPTTASDPSKRLRNLKKKLKEIEILEDKIKSKELKTPDKDQMEKVGRKKQLEEEILALELSVTLNA